MAVKERPAKLPAPMSTVMPSAREFSHSAQNPTSWSCSAGSTTSLSHTPALCFRSLSLASVSFHKHQRFHPPISPTAFASEPSGGSRALQK